MKVLLVGPYMPSVLNFRSRLIAEMVRLGHEVVVAAPDTTPEDERAVAALGASLRDVPLDRTGSGVFADIAYMKRLKSLILLERPGLVFTYTIKPNVFGGFAAGSAGVPSVALVAGLGQMFTETEGGAGAKARVLRWVAQRLYERSNRHHRKIIFQNPDDIEDMVAAGCLADRGKTAVVNGSGVDLTHFVRASLPATPSFVMVTRLRRSKGVALFAEAARRLKPKYPETRFRLVGYIDEGPDAVTQQELDQWMKDGLEYSGPMSDVRPALAEANVFVLPSYYREGTPRAVLEAMATGRAIITTNAPGCRETIVDGESGFLIPPRDTDALVVAMDALIRSPDLLIRMADAAYERAVAKYDVNAVNREMIRLMGLGE